MPTKEKEEMSLTKESYGDCVPEELIPGILVRLPVKSLARFKSVSKNWYSLITTPAFANSQLQHSRRHYLSSSHLAIRLMDDDRRDTMFTLHLDLNDLQNNEAEQIKGNFAAIGHNFFKAAAAAKCSYTSCIGSCNGMLCIRVWATNHIYLWNPTTNERRLIPLPSSDYLEICHRLIGFGYASVINDYKLLWIVESHYQTSKYNSVHVYSLRHNKWTMFEIPSSLKQLGGFFDYFTENVITNYEARTKEAVVLNDALHWVVRPRCENDHYETNDVYILRFDMVNDSFERMADLKKIHRSDKEEHRCLRQTKLGVTEDNKLYVCQLYNDERKPDVVEMREWDDKRNSWKVMYRLEGNWNGNTEDNHKTLYAAGNGKAIVFEKRSDSKHLPMGKLHIFDGRKAQGLHIHVTNEYCIPSQSSVHVESVFNYVQSLISPNSFCNQA